MRRLLVISYIFLNIAFMHAQGGFIRFYDPLDGAPSEIYDILYDEDEQVLYALCDRRDTDFVSMRLLKIDTMGEVLKEALFRGESTFNFQINSNNNITKGPDGEFLVYGDLPFSGFQQFMYWFDDNLDSVRYKIIEESLNVRNNTTAKSLLIPDGYFLSGDKQKINFLLDYSLIKTDLEGNILWEKSYGDEDGRNNNLYHITELPNNEYILGGGISNIFSDLNSDYYLVHIDSAGNEINKIRGPDESRDGRISEVVYFEDDEGQPKLAFGSPRVGVAQNTFVDQIRYFITDIEGHITDSLAIGPDNDSFNYFSYNQQVEGGFIAAGQMLLEDLTGRPGIICKLNYEADTVWCHTYEVYEGESVFNKVTVTGMQILPSGSIFIAGNQEYFIDDSESVERPFIMKLDRNGCLEEDCLIVSTDGPIIIDPLIIYPNPALSEITISSPVSGFLSIYDLQGRVLLHHDIIEGDQSIDVSGLSKGILIYEIRSHDQIYRGKFVKL